MNNILKRPYPSYEAKNLWQRALTIGGFVFLLLFLFRPFGLNELPLSVLIVDTINYGLISATLVYILGRLLPFLFPRFFNEDEWTIGKEIFSILIYTAFIAVGNYTYNVVKGYTGFNWKGFLFMLFATLTVAAVVVFVIVLIRANRSLKRNLVAAKSMNNRLSTHHQNPALSTQISLPSEVESQSIDLHPERIICLSSDANYIICTYLDDADEVKEHRLRNRMKVIDELLDDYPFLFRCHRAFIINLEHIESVDGNAKGYSLQVRAYEFPIPVARSKGKELKALLDQF